MDIHAGEQKAPEFVAKNPNGRIPTLVDESTNTTISESAAILTYLADTYDKERKFSYDYKTPEYYKQLELMYFQMAGVGPMFGQNSFFRFFATEKIEFAIDRYTKESERLTGVLEEYLKRNGTGYLVGNHLSLADVCTVSWVMLIEVFGLKFSDYPEVKKWVKKMIEIPEIYKGFRVVDEPRVWPTKEQLE